MRARLAVLTRRVGPDRPVPADNLHLTLAFLGSSDEAQYDCYRRAAAGVRVPAFKIRLDIFGYWPRPRVAWLGCTQTPEALGLLVQQLHAMLEACGYQPEQRSFVAHVTLQRKARKCLVPKGFQPLDWTAHSFALVESLSREEGPEYRLLQEWPLAVRRAGQLDGYPV